MKSQSFLNGDFEINSGFCAINYNNASLNAVLPNTLAYGIGNEIDLMDKCCGYGTPISGNYFLCLANSGFTTPDAITLTLSAPLVQGNNYTICYYDRGYDVAGCCPPGVPLEVGVSTVSGAQGTIIYTSPTPTTNVWSLRTINFVAPNNGQYISFQAQNNNTRWTHIDDVQMNVCTTPIGFCCSGASLNFTTTADSCGQGNGTATVIPSGGVPPYTYTWNTLPVQTTATATGLTAGNYTVNVVDAAGCAISGNITVNSANAVTINVNPSAPAICFGQQSVIISATGAGAGGTYSWLPAGGLSSTTDSIVTANPSSTTTYTVMGNGTLGCFGTATVTVTVYPIPTSDFTIIPDPVCEGATVDVTYTGTASAAANYNWNFSNATVNSGIGQGPYQLQWNNAGSDNISLTVTENGCVSTSTVIPVSIIPLPDASFVLSAPEICSGHDALVTYTGTSPSTATYNWNFATGIAQSGTGQGPYDVLFPTAGLQIIQLTLTDSGCTSGYSDSIIVDATPVASFYAVDTIGCDSLLVSFTNQSTGGNHYEWKFGDGATDTTLSPAHLYTVGWYDVTLIVSNNIGCADTLVFNNYIHVYPTPVAAFTVDPAANTQVYLSDATFQFTNQSVNATSYDWTFGDGANSIDVNPMYSYTYPGEYEVTLVASNPIGCMDTAVVDFLDVENDPSVFVPNAFTPNGDGLNDQFKPFVFQATSYNMKVFSRWGELVFQTNDPDVGWDGNFNSQPEQIGTYVYLIQVIYETGKTELLKGNLTLLR